MHILFLTTYFLPDSAANGILMKHLAESLRGLGHQIDIITSFPHYGENRISDGYRGKLWSREYDSGMGICRLYLYVPRDKDSIPGRTANYASWNLLSTSAGLLGGKYDLLFIPSPPLTNGISGFLINKLRGMPFIYNVQDIYPDVAVRLGILKSDRMIRAFKSIESFVYSKAAAVSVISDGFKTNLLAKGVPEAKLHVIPNFVDTQFIRPLPRRNRFSTANGLDNRFVVLFAGNVGLSQGLDRVLEAAALLIGQPEVQFWIVGNGAAKASLLVQAERMGLVNVSFLPFFPYEEIPDMYASSDVCLVPLKKGLTEESVPSKVFSILAAARPVIASVDEGSDTWRLVKTAECGSCIAPENPHALADAILEFLRDRDLGPRMGANGRRHVEEHYSRRQIAREYEQLFMKVIQGRP